MVTPVVDAAEEVLVRKPVSAAVRARRAAGSTIIDNLFRIASFTTKYLPIAHPRIHGVEVQRDFQYFEGADRAHRLDVYKPIKNSGKKLPIVFYIHGGGFRILSKDSHWLFGLLFARRGYLVFNVGYRLAPKHPFPAAVEDVCRAYEWMVKNAERFGGDLDRVVVAGESAGANLATSLVLATHFQRPEPYAKRVFDLGVTPKAAIPACGMLQVSDPERYVRRKNYPVWLSDRLNEVSDAYLKGVKIRKQTELDLADPVCVLEREGKPDRPLPPFFTFVGTSDPLLDDTRRLKVALERRGVACDIRYYTGEMHAFHAFVFRGNARQCWRDSFRFLEQTIGAPR
jgi:acetyl esterase